MLSQTQMDIDVLSGTAKTPIWRTMKPIIFSKGWHEILHVVHIVKMNKELNVCIWQSWMDTHGQMPVFVGGESPRDHSLISAGTILDETGANYLDTFYLYVEFHCFHSNTPVWCYIILPY